MINRDVDRSGQSSASDEEASARLFSALYTQLHTLAKSALRRQGSQLTLDANALLHETYLDISKRESLDFPSHAEFIAYAARVMRGLIVSYVRESQAQKRGADVRITGPVADDLELGTSTPDLERINDALDELASYDVALAELVDLKFFCGFSFAEIASMRDVSERTVQRDWNKARLYLHEALFP